MLTHGKHYYLAPAYPPLLAAGAVWVATRPRLGAGLLALHGAGLLLAPLAVPLLAPASTVAFQRAVGIEAPRTERLHQGALPQHFADRFGWPELVAGVASAWRALPDAERRRAVILAGNYGEAGALDQLGPRRGLPPAISPHNAYWLWGPRGEAGDTLICVHCPRADLERGCASVEDGPRLDHPFAMPYERFTIYVCHCLRRPLRAAWPRLKVFN